MSLIFFGSNIAVPFDKSFLKPIIANTIDCFDVPGMIHSWYETIIVKVIDTTF